MPHIAGHEPSDFYLLVGRLLFDPDYWDWLDEDPDGAMASLGIDPPAATVATVQASFNNQPFHASIDNVKNAFPAAEKENFYLMAGKGLFDQEWGAKLLRKTGVALGEVNITSANAPYFQALVAAIAGFDQDKRDKIRAVALAFGQPIVSC